MRMLLASIFMAAAPATIAPAVAMATPSAAKMKPFVDSLLKRMTLEEKIGQLTQFTADMDTTGGSVKPDYEKDLRRGAVGAMLNAYTPSFTRKLQKIAVEETRMKIPLLFGYDVIHGHRTIFPIPLGESATWNLSLIEKSARVAATEAAADGIHWTFGPMVDVSRDPRWGRVAEGAGEDPWLGSRIAEARVHGFQGNDVSADDSVLACVKHFAAYGAVQGGRDYNVVDMSERELFETYMPPYEAAVKAGAGSVMTAFNEISGVPSTSNRWLLSKILREKWGFKGFVVTDYTAINELVPHGVAVDESAAALLAFNAGVDMDMQGEVFNKYLAAHVKAGRVSVAAIDTAARRVLEMKYKIGLFDDPYRRMDEKRVRSVSLTKDNLNAAREVARNSFVLLKNDSALPLKRTDTIAVIGPFAEDKRNLIGNWSAAGDSRQPISLLEGLKAAAPNARFVSAMGANYLEDQKLLAFLNEHGGQIPLDSRTPQAMMQEAIDVAQEADVIVLALGETQGMTGEAASRTRIRLPENQQALLRALRSTGKPIVLVLFNGRPLVIREENELASAILEAWFPGTMGGAALADVLFGDFNPTGRLTMSFPYTEGQIPVHYGMKSTGRPYVPGTKYTSHYLDSPNDPLFPFGYGLSYTNFDYSEVRLNRAEMKAGGTIEARVTVKNSGERDGEETVQLYLHDVVASLTRPSKQLRGFQKIFLKAGESRELVFKITEEDLKFYDINMKWISEPGTFDVMVGPNSMQVNRATFRLL